VISGPPSELEAALMARHGRREGEEIRFRCPYPGNHANGDASPSARYHLDKAAWVCDVCGNGGGWKKLCDLLGVPLAGNSGPSPRVVADYEYRSEDGTLVRRKRRWEPGFSGRLKSFSWEKTDGRGGWAKCKGDGNPGVLYGSELLPAVRTSGRTVFVVEGEKDCDRGRALNLATVCNPEGAGEVGTKPKWKESYSRQLSSLAAVVIADKDGPGRAHAQAVVGSLTAQGSSVRLLELPGDSVKDLSDWIAAREQEGKGPAEIRTELDVLVESTPTWRAAAAEKEPAPSCGFNYRSTADGLVYLKPTREGEVPQPLTNFEARITAQILYDDGVETFRSLEIEARQNGRTERFSVGGAQFSSMSWVVERMGPTAVVYAGFGTKDHARTAIQLLSTPIENRTLYAHLGWRQIEGKWCYLSAAGALGALGPVAGVEVTLAEDLRLFELPFPPRGGDLHRAVRASLGTLDILPDEVSLPLYCAIWRAVLGPCDFSLHLAGRTGAGKSECAALAQQHFGAGLDARHLPCSWSSTANALEALAFATKDALLVVDDFAPSGTSADVQRIHREAARLLRAQGNRAGRQRLRPDATQRPTKAPRGLLLSTGEEIPNAHSIRARTLVLEVAPGALSWGRLTACQSAGSQGLYSQALAAFIRWLAPRYAEVQADRARRAVEFREQATTSSAHRRTPSLVAELAVGLDLFLRFTCEEGILSEAEAQALGERGWSALGRAGAEQAEHLEAADPVDRFLDLLRAAIAAGRAHVASAEGEAPPSCEVWGWRQKPEDRQPQGDRIGWVRGEDLFLEPDVAYRAAQLMSPSEGIATASRTLWRRLHEAQLLASVDAARGKNLVRVSLQGVRRSVLHLRTETLMPQVGAQQAQQAQPPIDPTTSGPIPWARRTPMLAFRAQETGPAGPFESEGSSPPGPVGPIGPQSATRDEAMGGRWEEA
jgi:hypothetical protein